MYVKTVSVNQTYIFLKNKMASFKILLLLCTTSLIYATEEKDDTVLYYYGLEASERQLPACGARQACAALLRRYWRRAALLRLCRCAHRRPCDAPAPRDRTIDLNNISFFQFCDPVKDWPICVYDDTALTVKTDLERMNPDELEELHHKNIRLNPPTVDFNCRCREPNHWKLNTVASTDKLEAYKCGSLPLCKTGDFCGNVRHDTYALYQSCLCPENHICVHDGGVPSFNITELLYKGRGWKAYCRNIGDETED